MLQAKARTAVRGMLLAALVLCLGAAPVQGQATLRYKFKAGDKLNYDMHQKMNMKMSVMGNDIAMNMNQQIGMTWHVLEVTADGKARISQKIDDIRMTMEGPPPIGKTEYDSKIGKEPEGPIGKVLGPMFNALAGAEFTVTMDARGEISDVKVPEKLADVLKKAVGGAPGLGDMFSPEGLKRMINQGGLVLPKQQVTRGETWKQTMETKMPFGAMKVINTMTYEGPANGGANLEKISVSPVVSLEPDPNAPIAIKVKGGAGKGTAVFDNSAGRVVDMNITQNMQMEISAGGQDITQSIQTTTMLKLKK